jgi:hypothetical protein
MYNYYVIIQTPFGPVMLKYNGRVHEAIRLAKEVSGILYDFKGIHLTFPIA